MDVKALAKSKRAHSLHHSKKHQPHKAPKAPVVVGDQKPSGKQVKEKPLEDRPSRRLPSNWDRYDDAFSMASEEAVPISAPPGVVAPKSKGADYAYLILEANAQAEARKAPVSLPFTDDITYDFGPMLVSRGQSILSWVEDDGFDFDGEESSTFQVPFLSVNLDALAKQLAGTKPSDRWFVNSSVLPKELVDGELQEGVDAETHTTAVKQESDISSNHAGNNSWFQSSSDGAKLSDETASLKSVSQQTEYVAAPMKPSGFVAASAEAELDMLLSSFTETKIFDTVTASPSTETARDAPKVSRNYGKGINPKQQQ